MMHLPHQTQTPNCTAFDSRFHQLPLLHVRSMSIACTCLSHLRSAVHHASLKNSSKNFIARPRPRKKVLHNRIVKPKKYAINNPLKRVFEKAFF